MEDGSFLDGEDGDTKCVGLMTFSMKDIFSTESFDRVY